MESLTPMLMLCLFGVAAGLYLLWRGLAGYRAAVTIGDTATSSIASLAAGEVRVSGTIEAGEATLVSPLQSVPCVWYRARVRSSRDNDSEIFAEERAVGFRVRDADGVIRVFPNGARIGAAPRFDASTGFMGDAPAGLNPRTGSAYGPGAVTDETPFDREAAIAALLTVRRPSDDEPVVDGGGGPLGSGAGREYEESRLEPGDLVTIVGTALPFGHLPDPSGADRMDRAGGDPLVGADDPLVAAELAEARAAGTLMTPEEAWGNAAIPGFGIGRPVREPELDAEADRPVLAPEERAREAEARFDIDPDTLVIAATDGSPLRIAEGAPEAVVAQEQGRFLVGLLGAVLAVGSAIVAAIVLGGQPA